MNTNQTDPVVSRFLEFRQAQAEENNGYIIDMLKFSLESGEIIAVYSNSDETDKFKVGRVIALTNEDVILFEYAPNGWYDGYLLVKTDDIYRTECGGDYLEKIQRLRSRWSDIPEAAHIGGEDLIPSLLGFARENRLAVTIQLYDSGLYDIKGFVAEAGAESALIEQLNGSGSSDGFSAVYYNSMTCIACDSEDEQTLKYLNENK